MCDESVENPRPLNEQTRNRLERHRVDYAEVTGQPFEHFFCPIMFEDVPAQLIRGHIINEEFKGSPGAWVVQRGSVDNFFGGFFEGDFEITQHLIDATPMDCLFDKKLYAAIPPTLSIAGRQRHYFIWKNTQIPPGHEIVILDYNGQEMRLCVEATLDELRTYPLSWTIPRTDFRIPALVSLIKAAHLSMFSLFGYRYVLSHAGRFIGRDVLGNFYRANRTIKKRKEAQRRAFEFFKPLKHMIRPIQLGTTTMEGTLTDGLVNLCATASGGPWAMVIVIKTGDQRSAALIPHPDGDEAMEIYRGFLDNEREQIHVMRGIFEGEHWRFETARTPMLWLKSGEIYPQRFD
jgi:hypothetical protein